MCRNVKCFITIVKTGKAQHPLTGEQMNKLLYNQWKYQEQTNDTQQYGWNSKAFSHVKETKYKRLHTVLFQISLKPDQWWRGVKKREEDWLQKYHEIYWGWRNNHDCSSACMAVYIWQNSLSCSLNLTPIVVCKLYSIKLIFKKWIRTCQRKVEMEVHSLLTVVISVVQD